MTTDELTACCPGCESERIGIEKLEVHRVWEAITIYNGREQLDGYELEESELIDASYEDRFRCADCGHTAYDASDFDPSDPDHPSYEADED